MAGVEMVEQVIATVDASRSRAIVWWTIVRPDRTASMARNRGAWMLRLEYLESLQAVTFGKVCLSTPTGRRHLASAVPGNHKLLDHGATLAGVLGEQLALSTVLANASSKSATKELRWPLSPPSLNVSTAKHLAAPKPVQRALAIADWLVDLSEFWECMEAVRLGRPALRKHDVVTSGSSRSCSRVQ